MARKLGRIALFFVLILAVSQAVFASSVYYTLTITGGESAPGGVWDSGTVTVTVDGHSESASYGQFSTPASIASALAVKLTKSCGCSGGPACARAIGSEIILKGRNGAPMSSVSVTVSSALSASSFGGTVSNGAGNAAPQISSISPTSGKIGSQVVISGNGFGSPGSGGLYVVTFDGEIATALSWTNNSIVVVVPDDASTGDVIVTANGIASNEGIFTVISDSSSGPILSGTIYSYAATSFEGNGNITKLSDSVMGQWDFSYDGLNRLSSGTPNSGPYRGSPMNWSYDPFGNRTAESVSGSPSTWAQFGSDNRISATTQAPGGYSYDSSGNVVNDGLNQYAYDAEGRLCAVRNGFDGSFTQYVYDAEGNRIAKGRVNSLSCDGSSNGFVPVAQYLVGKGGEQISELDGAGNWLHSNVYLQGNLLATYDASGLHYQLTDALGTKRYQVLADLTAYEACLSLPYGNNLECYGPSSWTGTDGEATEHHFTGKERDSESGNDYFMARYYNSTIGRFLSPDWSAKEEPVPYAKLDDPQTLNLYSYVDNNPLARVDADGHEPGELIQTLQQFEGEFPIAPVVITVGVVTLGAELWDHRQEIGRVVEQTAANTTTAPGPYVGPLQPAQANSTQSTQAQQSSSPASGQSTPALPKPPAGPGKVPKNQRDKQRLFTKKQTQKMLDKQGGTCAGCREPKDVDEVDGHHIVRHADGGPTNPDTNGAALCNGPGGCHEKIHKP